MNSCMVIHTYDVGPLFRKCYIQLMKWLFLLTYFANSSQNLYDSFVHFIVRFLEIKNTQLNNQVKHVYFFICALLTIHIYQQQVNFQVLWKHIFDNEVSESITMKRGESLLQFFQSNNIESFQR